MALYNEDKNSKLKDCYENREVQELYSSYLGKPLSHMAIKLLHTSYHSRKYKKKYLK